MNTFPCFLFFNRVNFLIRKHTLRKGILHKKDMEKLKNDMENSGILSNLREEYILSSPCLRVYVSPCGAGIHRIYYKYPDNTFKNIALTLQDMDAYTHNSSYAGATLAPASGRVEQGKLRLNSRELTLDCNENGRHHLHGGSNNLSFSQWNLTQITSTSAHFTAYAKDGLDGYPGNRRFEIEYKVNGNQLEIWQNAWSDEETYFNLSNHTYFNLNSFFESGLDQYLHIRSEQAFINDKFHIPRNVIHIKHTALDFQTNRSIRKQYEQFSEHSQIQYARGYNHCFLLNKENPSLPDATLISLDHQIQMDLYTDAPALVLYTGGFLDSSLQYWKDDTHITSAYPGCAIALEPSSHPVCNGTIQGMQTFTRHILYKFLNNRKHAL